MPMDGTPLECHCQTKLSKKKETDLPKIKGTISVFACIFEALPRPRALYFYVVQL